MSEKQKTEMELKTELLSLKEEQFKIRMQKTTGQLAQTHLIGKNKKNIAKVKTAINCMNGRNV